MQDRRRHQPVRDPDELEECVGRRDSGSEALLVERVSGYRLAARRELPLRARTHEGADLELAGSLPSAAEALAHLRAVVRVLKPAGRFEIWLPVVAYRDRGGVIDDTGIRTTVFDRVDGVGNRDGPGPIGGRAVRSRSRACSGSTQR